MLNSEILNIISELVTQKFVLVMAWLWGQFGKNSLRSILKNSPNVSERDHIKMDPSFIFPKFPEKFMQFTFRPLSVDFNSFNIVEFFLFFFDKNNFVNTNKIFIISILLKKDNYLKWQIRPNIHLKASPFQKRPGNLGLSARQIQEF